MSNPDHIFSSVHCKVHSVVYSKVLSHLVWADMIDRYNENEHKQELKQYNIILKMYL